MVLNQLTENEILTVYGKDDYKRCEAVNIEQVKQELLLLAKGAAHDYEKGFAASKDDTICSKCTYKLYCPKWG